MRFQAKSKRDTSQDKHDPFDMNRAANGDRVQMLGMRGIWHDVTVVGRMINGHIVVDCGDEQGWPIEVLEEYDLRMKPDDQVMMVFKNSAEAERAALVLQAWNTQNVNMRPDTDRLLLWAVETRPAP